MEAPSLVHGRRRLNGDLMLEVWRRVKKLRSVRDKELEQRRQLLITVMSLSSHQRAG